uniref:Uncharacterized protein n=1 Tax=Opuntia streptacantha TaxID=393608 RepID=A0A7C9ERN3_OPUST
MGLFLLVANGMYALSRVTGHITKFGHSIFHSWLNSLQRSRWAGSLTYATDSQCYTWCRTLMNFSSFSVILYAVCCFHFIIIAILISKSCLYSYILHRCS